jgi:acyl-coenzyme A synthetase/AMP-(fatty) acid ligase
MRAQAGINGLAPGVLALGLPEDHVLLCAPDKTLRVADLRLFAQLGVVLAGAGVALCLSDPFDLVRALLTLDGRVAALMLLSPDLPADTKRMLMREAGISVLVSDRVDLEEAIALDTLLDQGNSGTDAFVNTEWLLTTSGTTGMPKLVRHQRASIFRAVKAERASNSDHRWAMLYDPSRFAGTQVLAQSLLTGATLLTPRAGMTTGEIVEWLCKEQCTHISATPSLWRRLLMAPAALRLPLKQITLGGEIADDAILRALKSRYPKARITHIYASTEAGTGFAVRDGKAGFPTEWLEKGAEVDGVRLSLRDGLLWLRPPDGRQATASHIVFDTDGFIRTGDRIAVEDERARFLGREDSTLNVGGVKVQVEAVEEIVHAHPAVAQCRITAKPSAMMGTLLTLSVVPRMDMVQDAAMLRQEIAQYCKAHLPPAARPATIRIVPEIPMSAAGKTERTKLP